jgi:hypothetical protein
VKFHLRQGRDERLERFHAKNANSAGTIHSHF